MDEGRARERKRRVNYGPGCRSFLGAMSCHTGKMTGSAESGQ